MTNHLAATARILALSASINAESLIGRVSQRKGHALRAAVLLALAATALPMTAASTIAVPVQELFCASVDGPARCDGVGISVYGDSEGYLLALSGTGNSNSSLVGGSVQGASRGVLAVSGDGDSHGIVALSGSGSADSKDDGPIRGSLASVSGAGSSKGPVAVTGVGTSEGELLAVSGVGRAFCHNGGSGASGSHVAMCMLCPFPLSCRAV